MKPIKTMLLGVVIALLGIGLVEPGIDAYLLKNFSFLSASIVENIFPIVSIGLILVGVIIAIVGLFLRSSSHSPF